MARDCRVARNNPRPEAICHNYGKQGHLAKNYRALSSGTYGQTVQACLNAIIPEGVGFNVEEQQNLEGTLFLFQTQVRVLFDTKTSNSFVVVRVICELGLVP